MNEDRNQIIAELNKLSDKIDPAISEVSVILAAGHGKRIKSEKSKGDLWQRGIAKYKRV